tara:strand:- start:5183 stop:6469 length:1287 start_codon:yes stop_codon:yes gene_type:complete
MNTSRRSFIKVGAIGGLTSLSLPQLIELQAKAKTLNNKKAVIIVWMNGGPSHHETFDPKPDAPQPYKGHFKAISTNVNGIQLPEHLVNCADCMDKWSIIRGLHHTNNNHSSAHEIMNSGYKAVEPNQQQNFYPSIGATIAEHAKSNTQVPPYVVIPNHTRGTYPGYLGHEFGPYQTKQRPSSTEDYKDTNFTLDDSLTINRVDNRGDLLKSFDKFRKVLDKSGMVKSIDEFNLKAQGLLTSGKAANAFNIEKESTFTKDLYGPGFGRDLLLARRLVENGVKMVTVKTPFGWDTHQNSDKSMGNNNLPQFDKAFSALIIDLHARGLIDDVMVVAWGEFGRTPKINANAGRDHWSRSMAAAIAGGKIKGGRLAGESDKTGSEPVVGITPPDVLATLYEHMGVNIKHHYYDHSGRPHPILNQGRILTELFS